MPHAFGTLVTAMDEYASPPTTVALTGPAAILADWRAKLNRSYLPRVLIVHLAAASSGLATAADAAASGTARMPASLDRPVGPEPQAWICQGTQCLPPVGDFETLSRLIAAGAQYR